MLIKFDFENGFPSKEVLKALREGDKLVLIKNFPNDDHEYDKFISKIGVPIREYRNNRIKSIFDVKVLGGKTAFKSLANSNLKLGLHTDCSDHKIIPNSLGLLCVENSEEGGGNTFSFLSEILKNINEDFKTYLLKNQWFFRKERRSILSKRERGGYRICYDRVMLSSFVELKVKEEEILREIEQILERNSFELRLDSGDLLLFRNDLVLHGRKGFDLRSNRLFKRIRFNIKLG